MSTVGLVDRFVTRVPGHMRDTHQFNIIWIRNTVIPFGKPPELFDRALYVF